ncbi:MAG: hypothetical protein LBD30_02040 [Verrucomicrobiales bacterium]|jgi:hypothetical protein|nr:hypothetical protein [Verrucomicrobiales bacterium]
MNKIIIGLAVSLSASAGFAQTNDSSSPSADTPAAVVEKAPKKTDRAGLTKQEQEGLLEVLPFFIKEENLPRIKTLHDALEKYSAEKLPPAVTVIGQPAPNDAPDAATIADMVLQNWLVREKQIGVKLKEGLSLLRKPGHNSNSLNATASMINQLNNRRITYQVLQLHYILFSWKIQYGNMLTEPLAVRDKFFTKSGESVLIPGNSRIYPVRVTVSKDEKIFQEKLNTLALTDEEKKSLLELMGTFDLEGKSIPYWFCKDSFGDWVSSSSYGD